MLEKIPLVGGFIEDFVGFIFDDDVVAPDMKAIHEQNRGEWELYADKAVATRVLHDMKAIRRGYFDKIKVNR